MGMKKVLIIFGVAATIVAVGLFLAGWFGRPREDKFNAEDEKKIELIDFLLRDSFASDGAVNDMEKVDGKNIQNYLKEYASVPHMAGLDADENIAKNLRETWMKLGLDQVDIKGYEVLLDYPDPDQPNRIFIRNESDVVLFENKFKEDTLHSGDDHPDFVNSFLAYSAAGKASGNVVYVNYGRKEDFELISNVSNPSFYTNVTGNICLVRYGQIFRGNKAQNSEMYGCIGMVVFSDPADVAANGTTAEDTYPNTFWLPATGMQRGSLLMMDGDPMTPNSPSIEKVYRSNLEDVKDKLLPQIPCQPIGYGDAGAIMALIGGKEAPEDWQGKIGGVSYKLGGSFVPECSGCIMEMETFNNLTTKFSSNVIGILRGDVEPDRYVIVGNHRDAWGYGAVDPSSGTAQMTEAIRILGSKVATENWRPRRTIVFASWGAEEYGLTGSREFVEDFVAKLTQRAVAYLNVDICTGGGDILTSSASPTIKHKVIEAAKAIPGIRDPTKTYYEFWKNWTQQLSKTDKEPEIYLPGAGSDHASFIFYAGVPVIDMSFDPDVIEFPDLEGNSYPAYHTGYETIFLVDSILDPNFKIRESCSKLNLRLIRDLADSIFLDLRPEAYFQLMNSTLEEFANTGVSDILHDLDVSLEPLKEGLQTFNQEVTNWRQRLETLKVAENPMIARYVNDQMMKLDRVFLLPQGLPDRPIYRHAIISPSLYNSYSSGCFPGITDLINGVNTLTPSAKMEKADRLRQHISDLMVVIHQASDYLKDVSSI